MQAHRLSHLDRIIRATNPQTPYELLSVPQRMARVMAQARLVGGEDRVTREDFKAAVETCDLADADLDANIGQAKRLLEEGAAEPVYDRAGRLSIATRLVTGMMPNAGAIHAALRHSGYTIREIADFWPELIEDSADTFHAVAGARQ